jgi:DNA damage-binding protein 1
VPFNQYRSFKTEVREEEEPMRFVDGELIERYSDLSPEFQEQCIEGLIDSNGKAVTVEDIKQMVDVLRRLH